MGLKVENRAELDLDKAGAPENGIFHAQFWRDAMNGQPIPGEEQVPDRLAQAVAVLVSRFMGEHAPPSECKAVVALIALANAKYGLALFRRDVGLRNLERLEQSRCNENIDVDA